MRGILARAGGRGGIRLPSGQENRVKQTILQRQMDTFSYQ